MKTKLTPALLALAAIACSAARSEEALIDADGDGYAETVIVLDEPGQIPALAPVIVSRDPTICGGADDDQMHPSTGIVGGDGADFFKGFIPQGIVTDPTQVIGGGMGPVPQMAAPDAASMTSDGGGWSPQSSTASPYLPPVCRGLFSDTLGICGGNGNDSIVAGPGAGGAPGATAAGGFAPPVNSGIATDALGLVSGLSLTDKMILDLLATGLLPKTGTEGATLWGGGGTDEKDGTRTDATLLANDPLASWLELTGLLPASADADDQVVTANPSGTSI